MELGAFQIFLLLVLVTSNVPANLLESTEKKQYHLCNEKSFCGSVLLHFS